MQEDVAALSNLGRSVNPKQAAKIITIHYTQLLVRSKLEDGQNSTFKREKTPLPLKEAINPIDWS